MTLGSTPSIAIIGSFKQHYDAVLTAIQEFKAGGIRVASPAGADVIEPGIPFVRFTTDEESYSDAEIQYLTLRNIFAADAVYVVAPSGYVGRTTCFEIGRVLQRRQPLYFSEHPKDLPVQVPPTHVLKASELCARLLARDHADWLATLGGVCGDIERELTS